MRNRTGYLALLIGVFALFVSVGGPAYAAKKAKQLTGKSIKAGSISSKQLGNGSVTLAKLASSTRAALKGATGPAGPQGPPGADGATGGTGPTGGMDLIDATGSRIGAFAGYYNFSDLVMLDSGALLIYDGSATNLPTLSETGLLFYRTTGCASTPYMPVGSFPVQFGVVLDVPPNPGSTIYVKKPGTPQSFTALSQRTAAGCVNTSTAKTNLLQVQPAGTVPTVQKPLALRSAG